MPKFMLHETIQGENVIWTKLSSANTELCDAVQIITSFTRHNTFLWFIDKLSLSNNICAASTQKSLKQPGILRRAWSSYLGLVSDPSSALS